MIDFIVKYYREIIDLLLVITSLVLFVVRKKPIKVVDTLREVVIRLVPGAILAAEKQELKGDGKKTFALSVIRGVLTDMGYDFTDELVEFASEQIEVVLSTPQKKGI